MNKLPAEGWASFPARVPPRSAFEESAPLAAQGPTRLAVEVVVLLGITPASLLSPRKPCSGVIDSVIENFQSFFSYSLFYA